MSSMTEIENQDDITYEEFCQEWLAEGSVCFWCLARLGLDMSDTITKRNPGEACGCGFRMSALV